MTKSCLYFLLFKRDDKQHYEKYKTLVDKVNYIQCLKSTMKGKDNQIFKRFIIAYNE